MPPAGRLDLHVVARFLARLVERPTTTRSALQRAVGLNYDLFCKYLDALTARGLVEVDDGALSLTREGLRVHRELIAWLHDLFGPGGPGGPGGVGGPGT